MDLSNLLLVFYFYKEEEYQRFSEGENFIEQFQLSIARFKV